MLSLWLPFVGTVGKGEDAVQPFDGAAATDVCGSSCGLAVVSGPVSGESSFLALNACVYVIIVTVAIDMGLLFSSETHRITLAVPHRHPPPLDAPRLLCLYQKDPVEDLAGPGACC